MSELDRVSSAGVRVEGRVQGREGMLYSHMTSRVVGALVTVLIVLVAVH